MTAELHALRTQIDAIDEKIVGFAITAEVGKLKARDALNPVDPNREAEQAERFRQLAAQHGLNPELVAAVFRVLIDEVVRNHRAA